MRLIVYAAIWIACVCASETVFNVNDDIYAFPQYEIVFSDDYISHDDASVKLERSASFGLKGLSKEVSSQDAFQEQTSEGPESSVDYDYLVLNQRPYLCEFPHVKLKERNGTEERPSRAEQEKELIRAADRGKQLLQDMEGNQCLFYSTGWWTYSFCYNSYVKQFHALSPGSNGGRVWPPQEDPTTPSYILGKYEQKTTKDLPAKSGNTPYRSSELQTKPDTTYLTQHLGDGTPCDLTGKNRHIEVQFHCNPQLTDRIGLIKETSTCAYMMVVYTPRLCNDVAFLPPQQTQAHPIKCKQILTDNEIQNFEADKAIRLKQEAVEESAPKPVIIGNIQVGAMQILGIDGMKLQRGRIVMSPEEKAEIIIQQKNGNVEGLSKADLKRLQINPDDVETFKQELQKIAKGKDWKIERFDDANGQIQLRGIVATDDKEEGDDDKQLDGLEGQGKDDEQEEGSREVFKDEL